MNTLIADTSCNRSKVLPFERVANAKNTTTKTSIYDERRDKTGAANYPHLYNGCNVKGHINNFGSNHYN